MKFLWNSECKYYGLLSFIPSTCFLLICTKFYLRFQSAVFLKIYHKEDNSALRLKCELISDTPPQGFSSQFVYGIVC